MRHCSRREADLAFALGQGENGNFYQMFPMMSSFGVELFGNNNTDGSQLLIDDERGLAFARALGDLGERGIMSPDIDLQIALEAFTNGRAPFLVDGPWQLSAIQASGVNYAVDPIPSLGDGPGAPFTGFYGVVQSAEAENPLAASLFMTDFMTRVETHVGISEGNNTAPAMLAALEQRSSDPDIKGFGEVGLIGIPVPGIAAMGQIWGPAGQGIVAVLRGDGDPEELWLQMGDRIRQNIADAAG